MRTFLLFFIIGVVALFVATNDRFDALKLNAELSMARIYYASLDFDSSRGNRSADVAALDAIFDRWASRQPAVSVFSELASERAQFRQQCDIFRHLAPLESGVVVTPAATVRGEFVSFSRQQEHETMNRYVLYLHGGGYVMCSAQTHRGFVSTIVRQLGGGDDRGACALSMDYRMAPEHTLDEALEDALAGYLHLLSMVGPAGVSKRVIVMGDSAGGGLAVALLAELKRRQLPQPAAAVLFSPWLDLTGSGQSYVDNEDSDSMVSNKQSDDASEPNPFVAGLTRGSADVTHRFSPASWHIDDPLALQLSGLAPQLIFVSASELLRDDSVRYAALLRQANVVVSLDMWPGMPHIFPFFAHGPLPEVKPTLERLYQFVIDHQ